MSGKGQLRNGQQCNGNGASRANADTTLEVQSDSEVSDLRGQLCV
jgi:hypothetical protein